MTWGVKNPQSFPVKIQQISVIKISVHISSVPEGVDFVHHHRHVKIVPQSCRSPYMVIMMVCENYSKQVQTFAFHIVYESFRFISRIYDITSAPASAAYNITVAFQAPAYKPFYFHCMSP